MDPLEDFIDHSPLFHSERLSASNALARHRAALVGPEGSAMHSIVWPGHRLDELAALGDGGEPLAVALLADDLDGIAAMPDTVTLVQVETTIDTLDHRTCGQSEVPLYVEVPVSGADPVGIGVDLDVLADLEVRAKIRCGGDPRVPVPSVDAVAAFVVGCIERDLTFKVTGGLHHAWAADDGRSRHGLANLLIATAAAANGAAIKTVMKELTGPPRRIAADEIATGREWFRHLGTCSFKEPLRELALWLEPDGSQ